MSEASFLAEAKKKLETEKENLEKGLKDFAQKRAASHDWNTRYPNFRGQNLEEEADEVEEYSNLLPLEQILENRLKDVRAALEKLAKNNYGRCEKCGREIDSEILQRVPEARFCGQCQTGRHTAV